jgi:hypothetical protein
MERSASGTVNVRTFRPESGKGNPFHYGLHSAADAAALIDSYAASGLHVIMNETIAVDDGGVSGVRFAGVTEMAPGGTPRIVEEPGVCSLDDALADRVLSALYHLELPFGRDPMRRVEFSVHLVPCGYRMQRTIVWELEHVDAGALEGQLRWPNRLSRHIGDKAFGLLVAHLVALPVPETLVVARRVPPFRFGTSTGTEDVWVRTCPADFSPGRFPTVHGWADPFALMASSDPAGDRIASVVVQQGVSARWSGAARTDGGAPAPLVGGVRGAGDDFMIGVAPPADLPIAVAEDVGQLLRRAEKLFGPVRMEWAADDERVWVLQLNQQRDGDAVVVTAGAASEWLSYDPATGLDALRRVVEQAQKTGAGVELVREVGLTSHVGDILRSAGVPARIAGRG